MNPISFSLAWLPPKDESVWEVTRGVLHVTLNGRTIWGRKGVGLESTWLSTLEHLSLHWNRIFTEVSAPRGLVAPVEDLFEEGWREIRKDSLPVEERESFESDLFDYLEAHDIGAGVQGIYLPQLYLVRQGAGFRWYSIGQEATSSYEEVLTTLTGFGDVIASRLRQEDSSDRAVRSLVQWRKVSRA